MSETPTIQDTRKGLGVLSVILYLFGWGTIEIMSDSHIQTIFTIGIIFFIIGIILSFLLKGEKIEDQTIYQKSNLISLLIWWFGYSIVQVLYIHMFDIGYEYSKFPVFLYFLYIFCTYKLVMVDFDKLKFTKSVFNIQKILFSIGILIMMINRFLGFPIH
jgi:hypothetical protein